MAAMALLVRTVVLLSLVVLVIHKAWPGELLSTPLAQLTLGGLLSAFFSIGIGFSVCMLLLTWLIRIPEKKERDPHWAGGWLYVPILLVPLAMFLFAYPASDKHSRLLDALYGSLMLALGWLVS